MRAYTHTSTGALPERAPDQFIALPPPLNHHQASSVKVADSFALFVKAAQQKALPEGDP